MFLGHNLSGCSLWMHNRVVRASARPHQARQVRHTHKNKDSHTNGKALKKKKSINYCWAYRVLALVFIWCLITHSQLTASRKRALVYTHQQTQNMLGLKRCDEWWLMGCHSMVHCLYAFGSGGATPRRWALSHDWRPPEVMNSRLMNVCLPQENGGVPHYRRDQRWYIWVYGGIWHDIRGL